MAPRRLGCRCDLAACGRWESPSRAPSTATCRGILCPIPTLPIRSTGFFDGLQAVGALFLAVLVCSVDIVGLAVSPQWSSVRAQIKWLILAGVASAAFWIQALTTTWTTSDSFFLSLVLALMPLAVGVAILRYRLYDIDRIISRTTSYAW